MKRPSLALTMLIIFWVVYFAVAAYALHQALPPLNRELLLILSGAAVFPILTTLMFLFNARSRRHFDDRCC